VIPKKEKANIHRRTVREFVEELVTEGRSLPLIKAVAMNTRWNTQIDSVMKIATKLKNFLGR